MKKFAEALKGAINSTIDAATELAEGAFAVTTEAVNDATEAAKTTAKKAAETTAAVAAGAVEGAKKALQDDDQKK